MKPIFILAKEGEVSSRVVAGGDPGKVTALSTLLENPKLVNENRGFLVYTGTYKGEKITLAAHGIGGPSIAIVLEELAMLGAKTIVRYGTAGALVKDLKVGDFMVASTAAHDQGGLYAQYFGNDTSEGVADEKLTRLVEAELEKVGLRHSTGKVFTTEAFYAEDEHFAERHSKVGQAAVEMECATLFKLGKLRHLNCAAVLVISDNLVEKQYEVLDHNEINRIAERGAAAVFDALLKY